MHAHTVEPDFIRLWSHLQKEVILGKFITRVNKPLENILQGTSLHLLLQGDRQDALMDLSLCDYIHVVYTHSHTQTKDQQILQSDKATLEWVSNTEWP